MSTLTTNHPASVMGRSSSPAGSWLEQQARFAGANKLLKGSMATHEVNKTHEVHIPDQKRHPIRRKEATESGLKKPVNPAPTLPVIPIQKSHLSR